jgi:hypothetical protein
MAMLLAGCCSTNSAADATVCAPLMIDRPRTLNLLEAAAGVLALLLDVVADSGDAVVEIEEAARVVDAGSPGWPCSRWTVLLPRK